MMASTISTLPQHRRLSYDDDAKKVDLVRRRRTRSIFGSWCCRCVSLLLLLISLLLLLLGAAGDHLLLLHQQKQPRSFWRNLVPKFMPTTITPGFPPPLDDDEKRFAPSVVMMATIRCSTMTDCNNANAETAIPAVDDGTSVSTRFSISSTATATTAARRSRTLRRQLAQAVDDANDQQPEPKKDYRFIKNKKVSTLVSYVAIVAVFFMIFLCHLWDVIEGFFCCICCCRCPWFWKCLCGPAKKKKIKTQQETEDGDLNSGATRDKEEEEDTYDQKVEDETKTEEDDNTTRETV